MVNRVNFSKILMSLIDAQQVSRLRMKPYEFDTQAVGQNLSIRELLECVL